MHLESANSWWIREKENKMYVGDKKIPAKGEILQKCVCNRNG